MKPPNDSRFMSLVPLTATNRRPVWAQVAAALLPVVWWGLLTLTLGQPIQNPFILMLLPVLLASWWGGLYAGLVASGLAVVGAWDLGTDSPFLDWTRHGEPLSLFSAFTLFVAGLLVSVWREAIHRAALLVMTERTTLEEHKATEAALRESEEKYRSMAESASSAIISADDTGCIVAWNLAAEKLFGYTAMEALGQPMILIMPEHLRAGHVAAMARLHRGEPSRHIGHTVELEGLRKDGSEFPLELSLSTWQQGGRQHFTGIIQDISVRKAAEKARDDIFAETSDLIQSAAADGSILYVNRAWHETLGYTPAELPGLNIFQLIAPDCRDHCMATFGRLMQGENVGLIEVALTAKDGRAIQLEGNLSALMENGQMVSTRGIFRDITTRKMAEAENHRLAAIAARTHNAVILTDALGLIEWVNEGFTRILGYTLAEVRGRKPGAFLQGPESDPAVVRQMSEAVRRGEGFQVAIRNYSKDGRAFWLSIDAQPLHDADGRLTGFMAMEADITERKAAALIIEENEAQFRALFDEAPDAYLLMDSRDQGRITACNKAAEKMLRGTTEQIIGKTPADLSPLRQPDGQLSTAAARDRIRVVMETGSYNFEWVHVRLDGEEFWAQVTTSILPPADRGIMIIAWRDLTERKQAEFALRRSEEEFRTVVESSPNGIVLADDQGLITLVNAKLERDTGYARNELIGQPVEKLVPARHASAHPGHRRHYNAHPENRAMGAGRDLAVRRKDGSEFPAEIGLAPIITAAGKMTLATVVDISARKAAERLAQSEREQIEARERSDAANRAKSQFLSNMSHEIRTPLNIIIHSCYLLDKTALDEQQASRIKTIETAGEALLWQVNEILDLAKIESGEMPLQNHPFMLSALWDDLDRIFSPEAESRGLTLTLPSASSLRAVRLNGDQGKLRQTLTNLIANALKFTEHGEVSVEATLRTEMTGVTWLTVRVRDTGIGIPDDQLDHLFQPFNQLDTGDTRRYGGTGLGLSIIKLMSERVGGQYGVDSSLGKGSCFWIDWPFEQLPLVPEASRPALPEAPAGLELADTCILVADDNDVARDVCRHVLETQGAQVILAASGKEALERIAESPLRFDAVLMDIQMPGMDGLEACRHVRQGLAANDLPIIAFSAGTLSEQREAALVAGMTAFLSKPVKPRHLIETLRRLIADRRGATVPHQRQSIGPDQSASDWPTIDGLESDQARELSMGNLALYERLLTGFMARSPNLVQDLSSEETAKARAARHELLGMTGQIGATRLHQRLDALDGTGDNGHFDRAAVEEVKEAFHTLMDALDKGRADWQSPASMPASPRGSLL